jgi:chemotaxis protein methyltransferase WspC
MRAQTLLRRATGMSLSRETADRAVRQRMEQCGIKDKQVYLDSMTQAELTQLVELVVVPESWLFRDEQAFHAATEFVLARQEAQGAAARPVRILSLPCAGGEEPYSIAMALHDASVPREAYSIDAYDLSPGCIARAQAGVYGRNAFRSQDISFRDRFFTPLGDGEYRIADAVREQIRFSQGNLLLFDTVSRARYYDLIFCRNLLIYFDQPTTEKAIAMLSALLSDEGMLFAGYAEVPSFSQQGFTVLPKRLAFALKKKTAKAPAQEWPAPAVRKPEAGRPVTALAPAAVNWKTPPAQPQARPRLPARPPALPVAAAAAPLPLGPAATDLLNQARQLADRGQLADAADKCRACLAQAPDTAEAYFILGLLSDHADDRHLAEQHWRRCIYLQPDHYEALCHLALLAGRNGDQHGAATLKARAARVFKRRNSTDSKAESTS